MVKDGRIGEDHIMPFLKSCIVGGYTIDANS